MPIIEIEKDIERLNLITDRFSKVGSLPKLISLDLTSSINETLAYLKQRGSQHIKYEINLPNKKVMIPFF